MIFCWYAFSASCSSCWCLSSICLMRSSYSISMSFFSSLKSSNLFLSCSRSCMYFSVISLIFSEYDMSFSRSWYSLCSWSSSTLFLSSSMFEYFSSRSERVTRISSDQVTRSRCAPARLRLPRSCRSLTSKMQRQPDSSATSRNWSSYVMRMRVMAEPMHAYSRYWPERGNSYARSMPGRFSAAVPAKSKCSACVSTIWESIAPESISFTTCSSGRSSSFKYRSEPTAITPSALASAQLYTLPFCTNSPNRLFSSQSHLYTAPSCPDEMRVMSSAPQKIDLTFDECPRRSIIFSHV
mmetsp:Transcript_4403/g.9567  ORF Transcript_4403/g.9567 Transcript_4403/m.9567 type:complete len:296 (-) Transcript_4403:1476-2363(-)